MSLHGRKHIAVNKFVSNVDCGYDETCLMQKEDRREVKILSKYSQSGCISECQLAVSYFVQGEVADRKSEVGCMPWDFPKVFPDCESLTKLECQFHHILMILVWPIFIFLES